MSKVTDAVSLLAGPVAKALGLELWDVEYQREGGRWVLRVVIDREGGVSINDCEAVSTALDPLLDRADPIPGPYVLQVSSAGLERPLKRPSDFEKFMGSVVEVSFFSPVDGAKQLTGRLEAYAPGELTVAGRTFAMSAVSGVRLRLE